ncbi:hypothetical protein A3742_15445 [Oleiphilus sp. HI0071]|uniref:hypothetical protein n=1 Tax=Oleiphilus sp. HI0080 TaxID=1822255 RepID=UPI0007C3BC86|nr:hypothetical protein [Oleiphilus sp. HI0080]KZY63996.1 hypothetical protein A3737_14295 [Oleiphilus sp. HI0065]KZY90213.1 hypothetical protein A3742_15445 [Oleiphilus sp. HI0071]KZZ06124.1 hypothetical protein A3744_07565 [Oleiphilus sp. HI0073]KZZ40157.1 hypothetical protein A3758_09800 [Oleiphilus sp. HI0118]KZZ51937.1 hypothetical protein A3760_11285 [Oleiphilus sp. HI0122]KZZ76201.1 hypothetical protein A3765_10035 [Oleiphilus sp. HI0130]
MLDSHIHTTRLAKSGLVDTAFWESSEWGAWVIVHVENVESISADDILSAIRNDVEQGGPVCLATQASLTTHLNTGVQSILQSGEGKVSVLACRFDSFHYELCLSGSACAFLIDQEGGVTDLTPDAVSQSEPEKVSRILGDMHQAESLVLSADTLSIEMISDVGAESNGAELIIEHVVRQARSRNVQLKAPMLAVRYQDDIGEFQRSDFYHRSPIDRSRYIRNSSARPLFLLLVLLALSAILLVL